MKTELSQSAKKLDLRFPRSLEELEGEAQKFHDKALALSKKPPVPLALAIPRNVLAAICLLDFLTSGIGMAVSLHDAIFTKKDFGPWGYVWLIGFAGMFILLGLVKMMDAYIEKHYETNNEKTPAPPSHDLIRRYLSAHLDTVEKRVLGPGATLNKLRFELTTKLAQADKICKRRTAAREVCQKRGKQVPAFMHESLEKIKNTITVLQSASKHLDAHRHRINKVIEASHDQVEDLCFKIEETTTIKEEELSLGNTSNLIANIEKVIEESVADLSATMDRFQMGMNTSLEQVHVNLALAATASDDFDESMAAFARSIEDLVKTEAPFQVA